jgi:hypothetical protein
MTVQCNSVRHSSQPLGVQFEVSALELRAIWSINLVLDQHQTRPEVVQKATFSVALKGLEAARKYMSQFDTENNIILMCSKV